ncbi:DUF4097 family beta strand repeat-containing protein [Saccharopolyspora sp. NPDC050642]|uniref:DUF4097 family beta strand repeat-containing protein n=1 Tax=Saccharopolyspora sp. NPDC050642 TaxID=3157099 RepID=UPI0033D1DE76
MARVGLAVGGAALVLIGGAALFWWPKSSVQERTTALDGIDRVELAGGSGEVEVRHAPGGRGEIVQRVHRWEGLFWGSSDTTDEIEHRVEGGALVLPTDCGWNCSVDYQVTLPVSVPVQGNLGSGGLNVASMRSVQAETDSGEMTIADIGGPVAVRTGSGGVSVARVNGPVDAETGSGEITLAEVSGEVRMSTGSGGVSATQVGGSVDAITGSGEITLAGIGGRVAVESGSGGIMGEDLRGADIVAKAESGSVELRLTGPQTVEASTGSGGIELTVPGDHYRVDAETGSGGVDVGVVQDPAAAKRLTLSTGSGGITVRSA